MNIHLPDNSRELGRIMQGIDWEFVYKIPSSGDILYIVHIPLKSKVDAVEIFKREHPNALICRGIRKGDIKLFPFKEQPLLN